MNPKLTIGLAVLLVVMAAAYAFTGGGEAPSGATGTPGVETPQLISYTADQVTRISIKTPADSLTTVKDAMGTWGYGRGSAAPTSPADQTRIQGLAARLAGLKAQAKVTDAASDAQRTEFGLSQPEAEITAGGPNDSLTLVVGTQNPRRTGYYAQLSGSAPVYLVESSLVEELKRLVAQPPDPPTPTPSPTGTSTPNPSGTPIP